MYLGKLWEILNPLLQVAVFAVVFGVILKVSRGMDNYIGFLTIGVIFFGMLGRGLTQGNGLIKSSRAMLSAFSFPRAIVPLSASLKGAIDDIAPAIVAIAAAALLQISSGINWTILLTIPLFILIHVMSAGMTLITSRLTAFVPDLKGIISTLQRGLFFFSGVFYDVSRFADQPVLREIMLANPFYGFLSSVRECVLSGTVPPSSSWFYLSCWSFGTFIGGFLFFWAAEDRYSNVK
ncbi:ABC transporter permease [Corynebacterium incognita]|uniref:Transport permease protein n=2 Tax=Corynebacterium incognita TaxID=2754725 RepID=A0A7G7CQU1_9CORY|nr:ABC transporter permease [Corynebacterium incognita]